jgi:hypothetical protein
MVSDQICHCPVIARADLKIAIIVSTRLGLDTRRYGSINDGRVPIQLRGRIDVVAIQSRSVIDPRRDGQRRRCCGRCDDELDVG